MKKIQLIRYLPVFATTLPKFNKDAFVALVKDWLNPLFTSLLIIVPPVLAIVLVVNYIKYITMDENEQQQKPLAPRQTKMIFWAIVIESISAILAIFGFVI